MTKYYEITACGKNIFNRLTNCFKLNGDDEFSEGGEREYRNLAEAEGCFHHVCTQAQANRFPVYTHVTFELVEMWLNEDEDVERRIVCEKSYEVQDDE